MFPEDLTRGRKLNVERLWSFVANVRTSNLTQLNLLGGPTLFLPWVLSAAASSEKKKKKMKKYKKKKKKKKYNKKKIKNKKKKKKKKKK